jgi:hypothetical protein
MTIITLGAKRSTNCDQFHSTYESFHDSVDPTESQQTMVISLERDSDVLAVGGL